MLYYLYVYKKIFFIVNIYIVLIYLKLFVQSYILYVYIYINILFVLLQYIYLKYFINILYIELSILFKILIYYNYSCYIKICVKYLFNYKYNNLCCFINLIKILFIKLGFIKTIDSFIFKKTLCIYIVILYKNKLIYKYNSINCTQTTNTIKISLYNYHIYIHII